MSYANLGLGGARIEAPVMGDASAPVPTVPVAGGPSDDFARTEKPARVRRAASPEPETPARQRDAAAPVVSQLTLRRQHNGQETLVTLTPRAVVAFITAENHAEARDAIFGTEGSPVYIANPHERDVAYAVFMSELYNRPVAVVDAPSARVAQGDRPPQVVAVPTPDVMAEINQWIQRRTAEEGVARERFETIGGEGGTLRSMANACTFGAQAVSEMAASCAVVAQEPEPSAYAYRLGAGETLASVTVSSNFSLIEPLADAYGVDTNVIVGAMSVVARALNATEHDAGIGTGSEVLVVSFAEPESPVRRMLEAYLDRPREERRDALAELALTHFVNTGVLHHIRSAPVATAEEAEKVMEDVSKALGGDASQDVATRKEPCSNTRELLDGLRRSAAPSVGSGTRPVLASAFDGNDGVKRAVSRAQVDSEAIALGLVDDDQLYAERQRDLERLHNELDALGERQVAERVEHRLHVAEEVERAEIDRSERV